MIRLSLEVKSYEFKKTNHFVYPLGKSKIRHLLRYQGIAVDDYSFSLWMPWICNILGFCNVEVTILLLYVVFFKGKGVDTV
jgi:hypothetical protein